MYCTAMHVLASCFFDNNVEISEDTFYIENKVARYANHSC